MNFKDYEYIRPNYEENKKDLTNLLDQLEASTSTQEFLDLFKQINVIRNNIYTMNTLSSIRHTIDTSDEFYNKETEYWDEVTPLYQVFDTRLAHISLNKSFVEELKKEIPDTYFKLAECSIKAFDESIIPLLQEENRLSTEYGKLKASAKIEFDGEVYNLVQIGAKAESTDREYRKAAYDAKVAWLTAHEAEFDRIYDSLVQVRDKMAKQLGYENYIELGYYRMNRLDYNADMVANYRKQVLKDVVPSANNLFKRQAKRLGLDELEYYDLPIKYLNGNATPKGEYEDLINAASKMYHEMSEETGKFIDMMIDNELWDLKSKPNKENGGYCTSLNDFKVPFIFSNFNGTSGDVDVLTHEAGHAFQSYMSRDIEVPECMWPTMESCEIHSMSMEFFAHPWMELFFKEDANKYRFTHLADALQFIPYGVLVDHFQHEVYAKPNMTPEERKTCWRTLEKQYNPWKKFDGNPLFEKGCWWYQQSHIFQSPFYYIDYTLAQVCALQFWVRSYTKDPNTWKDYLHLCTLGGTKSFTQLVKEAGLVSPFEDGCLTKVVNTVDEYLNSIDDTKL